MRGKKPTVKVTVDIPRDLHEAVMKRLQGQLTAYISNIFEATADKLNSKEQDEVFLFINRRSKVSLTLDARKIR